MGRTADTIIDLYERHANAWDRLRGHGFIERAWIDRFHTALPPTPAVLDLGCGSGQPIGGYLIGRGVDLTGVDASPALIALCRERFPERNWVVADMRGLDLGRTFDGLIGWNSVFHLTPRDQRAMFPVFQRHTAKGGLLLFTSGTEEGEAVGEFEGEPLYHGSLDADEYRTLLDQHGYELLAHIAGDPDCGGQTVWLAKRR